MPSIEVTGLVKRYGARTVIDDVSFAGSGTVPVVLTPPEVVLTEFERHHVLAESGTLFLRYEARALR